MVKKHWIGKFAKHLIDGLGEYENYEMIVSYDKGNFLGEIIDNTFFELTGLKCEVKGFIQDDFISFIKQYPCEYFIDTNGMFQINKLKKGHQVTYQGNFNLEEGKWEGEWEIIIKSETFIFNTKVNEHFISGPWEMKLKL